MKLMALRMECAIEQSLDHFRRPRGNCKKQCLHLRASNTSIMLLASLFFHVVLAQPLTDEQKIEIAASVLPNIDVDSGRHSDFRLILCANSDSDYCCDRSFLREVHDLLYIRLNLPEEQFAIKPRISTFHAQSSESKTIDRERWDMMTIICRVDFQLKELHHRWITLSVPIEMGCQSPYEVHIEPRGGKIDLPRLGDVGYCLSPAQIESRVMTIAQKQETHLTNEAQGNLAAIGKIPAYIQASYQCFDYRA